MSHASPQFLDSPASNDDDRLVKIGRSVADLMDLLLGDDVDDDDDDDDDNSLEASLLSIVEECNILASDDLKVRIIAHICCDTLYISTVCKR